MTERALTTSVSATAFCSRTPGTVGYIGRHEVRVGTDGRVHLPALAWVEHTPLAHTLRLTVTYDGLRLDIPAPEGDLCEEDKWPLSRLASDLSVVPVSTITYDGDTMNYMPQTLCRQ